MIFVDTSAWYARYTPRDSQHDSATSFHRSNRELLVTTDYIVDETLTLLKVRGNVERSVRVGRALRRVLARFYRRNDALSQQGGDNSTSIS